jgi:hypothetical protein
MSSEDEKNWQGVHILGVGGYGVAGLWLALDSSNNITDVSSR